MRLLKKRYEVRLSFSPLSVLIGLGIGCLLGLGLAAHGTPEQEGSVLADLKVHSLEVVDRQGRPVAVLRAGGTLQASVPFLGLLGWQEGVPYPSCIFLGQSDDLERKAPSLQKGEAVSMMTPTLAIGRYDPKMKSLQTVGFGFANRGSASVTPALWFDAEDGSRYVVQLQHNRLMVVGKQQAPTGVEALEVVQELLNVLRPQP